MFRLLFLLSILSTSVCLAGPVAFGVEVGKTLLQEVQEKIPSQMNGVHEASGYTTYTASSDAIEKLEMPGLRSVVFYVNEQKVVEAVRAFFDKKSHSRIHDLLVEKYQVTKDESPRLGNKKTVMVSGDGYVVLNAPHLSFEMTVDYVTDQFVSRCEDNRRQVTDKSDERLKNNL